MEEQVKKKQTFFTKHPNLIAVGVSVVIVVLGFVLFVNPERKLAEELSGSDLASLERTRDQKQRQLLRIRQLAESIANLSPELIEKLEQSLPATPNEVDLLANLPALAIDSSMSIGEVRFNVVQDAVVLGAAPGTVTNQAFEIKNIEITINVDGISYGRLRRFLASVEENLRLIRVNQFDFDPGQDQSQITLTAFYMPVE